MTLEAPDVLLTAAFAARPGAALVAFDPSLVVRTVGGQLDLLGADPAPIGRGAADIFPEFVGLEADLLAILAGVRDELVLPRVSRDRSGGTITVDLHALPLLDENGAIDGLLVVVTDVSEAAAHERALSQRRNELELAHRALLRRARELQAENVELRRADRRSERYLNVAAHEVRAPITSILAYVELLEDGAFGELEEAMRPPLEVIASSARRLLDVVATVLEDARLASGRADCVLLPFDVRETIGAAVSELEPFIAAKSQRLDVDLAGDPPLVLGSSARIGQLVTNLLANAVQYTPVGGHIAVRAAPDEVPGYLRIAVVDDGIGIPSAEQARITDRFYRASNVAGTGVVGSGLGLGIARSIAELHGGRFGFDSQEGIGSTFWFTIESVGPDETWAGGVS